LSCRSVVRTRQVASFAEQTFEVKRESLAASRPSLSFLLHFYSPQMTETHLTAKENMDQKEPILLAGILHCYKCDVLPQSICFN